MFYMTLGIKPNQYNVVYKSQAHLGLSRENCGVAALRALLTQPLCQAFSPRQRSPPLARCYIRLDRLSESRGPAKGKGEIGGVRSPSPAAPLVLANASVPPGRIRVRVLLGPAGLHAYIWAWPVGHPAGRSANGFGLSLIVNAQGY